MTKPIEVTFPLDKWEKMGGETGCGIALLAKLRDAGIPAMGRIMLQGVEHGILEMSTDRTFGDAVYRWTPDPDYDPAEGL
jgi:hypothetical protein